MPEFHILDREFMRLLCAIQLAEKSQFEYKQRFFCITVWISVNRLWTLICSSAIDSSSHNLCNQGRLNWNWVVCSCVLRNNIEQFSVWFFPCWFQFCTFLSIFCSCIFLAFLRLLKYQILWLLNFIYVFIYFLTAFSWRA